MMPGLRDPRGVVNGAFMLNAQAEVKGDVGKFA